MKLIRFLTVAIVLVSLTACGSDDPDTSAPSGDSTPDVVAFCDAAADLDAGTLEGKDPTDAQLDRLSETAPPELQEDVRVLVASAVAYREGDDKAAASDEVQSAGKRLDQYVADNCDN